jgi:hypothetical protein
VIYKVFHGVWAKVSAVSPISVFAIVGGTGNDPLRQFDVDPSLTPRTTDEDWSDVQFDNYMTIGAENSDGWVYIEHGHYSKIYNGHIKNGDEGQWPPPGYPLGACTSIVYLDSVNSPLRRYRGYRAKIGSVDGNDPMKFRVQFENENGTWAAANTVDFSGDNVLVEPPWEAHLGVACLSSSSVEGTEGLLFLDSQYAAGSGLGLGDPKVPIGLGYSPGDPGDGNDEPSVPGSGKPHKPPPGKGPKPRSMQRISVSLARPDKILGEVLDKIDGEARVVGVISQDKEHSTVCSVVERRRRAGHPVAIDLIAHSQNGILQFGSWRIKGNDQACLALREEWKKHSPVEIRLLGCSTARVPEGLAAMQGLKEVFGEVHDDFRVYGSKTALFAGDFGPDGFLRDDLLIELGELLEANPYPAIAPGSTKIIESWFGRFKGLAGGSMGSLTTETMKEAQAASVGPLLEPHGGTDVAVGHDALKQLIGTLDGALYDLPGLLEMPEAELLYPATVSKNDAGSRPNEPVFHRVSSFLGGALVRLYTDKYPRGVIRRAVGSF